MTRIQSLTLACAALVAALSLGACNRNESADTTPPGDGATATTGYPTGATRQAIDAVVTGVELGTAVGPDERLTDSGSTFAPADTIHASVATRASGARPTPVTLTSRWTYQNGQVVKEDTVEARLSGDGRTTFSIDSPGGFPLGRYEIQILLNGEVVQRRGFEIR